VARLDFKAEGEAAGSLCPILERRGADMTMRASATKELSLPQAEQVEILRRAVEVIGSEPEALRWMGTPVRALNYATPISLLHDPAGYEAVRVVLGRLEHGIL